MTFDSEPSSWKIVWWSWAEKGGIDGPKVSSDRYPNVEAAEEAAQQMMRIINLNISHYEIRASQDRPNDGGWA